MAISAFRPWFCCVRSFPGGASGQESTCQCRRRQRREFNPWVRKIPWRRKWQPTPVFLHEKSHGQRSLVGYSPWGRKELDTTVHTCMLCELRQAILPVSRFCHPKKKLLLPFFLSEESPFEQIHEGGKGVNHLRCLRGESSWLEENVNTGFLTHQFICDPWYFIYMWLE